VCVRASPLPGASVAKERKGGEREGKKSASHPGATSSFFPTTRKSSDLLISKKRRATLPGAGGEEEEKKKKKERSRPDRCRKTLSYFVLQVTPGAVLRSDRIWRPRKGGGERGKGKEKGEKKARRGVFSGGELKSPQQQQLILLKDRFSIGDSGKTPTEMIEEKEGGKKKKRKKGGGEQHEGAKNPARRCYPFLLPPTSFSYAREEGGKKRGGIIRQENFDLLTSFSSALSAQEPGNRRGREGERREGEGDLLVDRLEKTPSCNPNVCGLFRSVRRRPGRGIKKRRKKKKKKKGKGGGTISRGRRGLYFQRHRQLHLGGGREEKEGGKKDVLIAFPSDRDDHRQFQPRPDKEGGEKRRKGKKEGVKQGKLAQPLL